MSNLLKVMILWQKCDFRTKSRQLQKICNCTTCNFISKCCKKLLFLTEICNFKLKIQNLVTFVILWWSFDDWKKSLDFAKFQILLQKVIFFKQRDFFLYLQFFEKTYFFFKISILWFPQILWNFWFYGTNTWF